MRITPGQKLSSTVSAAQFVVIRGSGEFDLSHAGEPLVPSDGAPEPSGAGAEGSVVVGKRYSDDSGDLELLCVRPGDGELGLAGIVMTVKAAKALPASD